MIQNFDVLRKEKKWDLRYLKLAAHVAGWSKDPSTHVGAVIVSPQNRIQSLGYNGFPSGVLDLPERYSDRELKLLLVSHAERNALDNYPHSVIGSTLYTTFLVCNECAKAIIQRGIKCVVCYQQVTYGRDPSVYHFDISQQMFKESGVNLVLYNSDEVWYHD